MQVYSALHQFVLILGEFFIFIGDTFVSFKRSFFNRQGIFIKQCEYIGVTSIGIIFVAAMFLGAVLGYQLFVSFRMFAAEGLLGGTVGVTLFRELGPVMTAIMVTGRAGSSMAAEISSMRISEQIDALEVMAVNPMEYLVAPRVMAGFVMVPILSFFFSAVATVAAALIACGVLELSWPVFWDQFGKTTDMIDMVHCYVKSAIFGLALTWIGCFHGYRASGGARSVGIATKTTVVATCLTILFCDYILTSLLPFGFKKLQATYW